MYEFYYLLILSIPSAITIVNGLPFEMENLNLNCPSTDYCECLAGSEFEIFCPNRFDPAITMRVEPLIEHSSNHIEIDCNTIDANIYNKLPEWNIGDSTIVKFKRCPLNDTTSIQKIFNRFNIRNVEMLVLFAGAITTENSTNEMDEFLPEHLFNNMEYLTSLDVRSDNLRIHATTFLELRNLQFLRLNSNDLSLSSGGIFQNQNQLKQLNLWGNNLQMLSTDSFIGLSSVIVLDLSFNKIDDLPANALRHFTSVEHIILNFNELSEWPQDLFNYDNIIQKIHIINNKMSRSNDLPDRFLANMQQLQHIWIEFSDLKNLPKDLFENSSNIENISLAHNSLIEIPHEMFNSQIHLVNLDLSYNNLTRLDDRIFNSCSELAVLRLSHNRLTKITRHLLSGLTNLQELHLENNHIHSVHMAALDDTDLRILQLQNNFIEFSNIEENGLDFETASPFQSLSKLEKLNLRNNSIEYFLNDWNVINVALIELDLSYNRIKMIDFGIILNIWIHNITIDLSHNQIQTLSGSKGFGNFNESRSTWILNENPLKCDCLIVHFANYLRSKSNTSTIRTATTTTTTWNQNDTIKLITDNLTCAEPLHFAGMSPLIVPLNGLICPLEKDNKTAPKKCPQGCKCFVRTFDGTAVFNCSNANLTKLPNLPNIRSLGLQSYELHIENNNISSLPLANITTGYQSVSRIFAKNNSIQHLDAANLPNNLITLDVSHNQLDRLTEATLMKLSHMPTLQHVVLGENAWICDCGTYGFWKFLKAYPNRINDMNDITCKNDRNVILLEIGNLCPIEQLTIICLSILVLIALILLMLTVFYYKYRLEIMVWMYAHYEFLWFFNKKTTLHEPKKHDAFILYAMADEEFLEKNLIPELENGCKPLKLCLLMRETKAGEFIPDQITKCVESSRRTVIILTPNFIDSFSTLNPEKKAHQDNGIDIWGLMGFRVAHKNALDARRSRVIIVTHGDIGPVDNFDSELKAYLRTNIFLRWNDRWFFDKLRLAVAHPKYFKRTENAV